MESNALEKSTDKIVSSRYFHLEWIDKLSESEKFWINFFENYFEVL